VEERIPGNQSEPFFQQHFLLRVLANLVTVKTASALASVSHFRR
jgi:hypothetical protein